MSRNASQTSFTPTPCHCGREIPLWVQKQIDKMRWDKEPDEMIVCGATIMYRHGDSWGYATLAKRGRHTCGFASYSSQEGVEKAARAHG